MARWIIAALLRGLIAGINGLLSIFGEFRDGFDLKPPDHLWLMGPAKPVKEWSWKFYLSRRQHAGTGT